MKRPYIKPEMCEVKLIAEEAVFAGCKTATAGPRTASGGQTGVCQGGYYGNTPCDTLAS
jgi:hypothetical protein